MMKKRLVKHGPYYTYEREQQVDKVMYGLVLVLCLLLLVAIVAQADRVDMAGLPRIEYTVQPGDTLWSIAQTYGPPGIDTREYVFELQRLNDINPQLQVGQTLQVIDGRCPK